MTDDTTRQLIRAVESLDAKVDKLDEKLDQHSKDTRDRWELHEKDHRNHDKEHSELYQREVKREERLSEGSKTMQESRDQIKELALADKTLNTKIDEKTQGVGSWVIASVVALVLVLPASVTFWLMDKFESKADKTVVARIDAKADATDVKELNAKLDALTTTMIRIEDKLRMQTGGP